MKKAIAAALASLAGGIGLVGLGSGPASANLPPADGSGVGCTWSACDDLGPVSQHCDDDGVLKTKVSTLGAYGPATAQLYYSAACKAYWTRAKSLNTGEDQGPGDPGVFRIKIERRMSTTNELKFSDEIGIASNTGSYDWTNMAGRVSGRKIRACVLLPAASSGDGKWHCTGYYYN